MHLSEPQGVIHSPGFPFEYPDNVVCTYLITVQQNLFIKMRFALLDIDRYYDILRMHETINGIRIQIYG